MKNKVLRQLLRMSSYFLQGLIIQTLCFSLLWASDTKAQKMDLREVKISIQFNDDDIFKVIEKLEKSSDFTFAFNRTDLKNANKVTGRYSNLSMYEILVQISRQANVKFRQVNSSINVSLFKQNTEERNEIEIIQTRTVTGTVTASEDNSPLPGVNIVEKGTLNGTISDADGKYALVVNDGATLIFSFVGYTTEEVAVGQRSVIDMSLLPDIKSLSEVVVIGYGTQDKKVTTAATATVKSDDIVKTNSLRIEQALQGQTPGVQISTNSGQPGESLKVRIRGTGTIGQSEPLYVVDGVPTEDISYLSTAAIERVDILKDAASAAIYGARAANGVVLITTKQGKSGETRISLDSYYGVQNLYKKLPMLTGSQYAVMMNEATINSGSLPLFTKAQIENFGEGTDWFGEVLNENAPIQNHSLSLTGGNDISSYATSLSYFQQEGIIGGNLNKSNFERINFSINSTHKALGEFLKFGENLTYSNVHKRGLRVGELYNNSLIGIINASPIFPVYDANGDFAKSIIDPANETNPIGAMYYQDFNKHLTDRLFGNIFGEIQPVKNLIFRSDFGVDLSLYTANSFNPVYKLNEFSKNNISNATQNSSRNVRWNWDNTLRYIMNVDVHSFEFLAGISAQRNIGINMNATKSGLLFNDFDHAYLNNGTIDTTVVAGGGRYEYALYSQFGRVNYNFNEKYLLSATVRRDGSSNFAKDNRYGIFPSVSAGWVISEEEFIRRHVPAINFLKLRASWGQNGNDRIGRFAYMATLSSNNKDYYFGSGETSVVGTSPDKMPNPDLKWEASEQTNIGIDATVLKHFTLSVDRYNKTTKDWLLVAPIPAIVGANAPTINGGTIENKGYEFALKFDKTFGDWSLVVNTNAAFNTNEVTDINNTEKIIHGDSHELFQGMGEVNRVQVGFPVGYFWGFQTNGIFQNTEQINSYINNEKIVQPKAVPGDVIFVDRNKDGVINDHDRTLIGDPNPDVTYGFNVNVGYKGFDFSVYTYGMAGHQNVFGVRNAASWYSNYTTNILNRWHGEGTSNRIPRVTMGDEPNQNYLKFSDLYIQNASFLRLKTVTLGYDFAKLIKNLPVQSVRVYFSANNLWTLTKYKGMDPEVGFGPPTSGSRYNMSQGFDIGYYPQPRTLLTGLSIKF